MTEGANNSLRIVSKLVQRVAEAIDLTGQTLHIKISIGIALSPSDGETAALLIKHADKAMYKAKGTAQQVVLFRQLNEPD